MAVLSSTRTTHKCYIHSASLPSLTEALTGKLVADDEDMVTLAAKKINDLCCYDFNICHCCYSR